MSLLSPFVSRSVVGFSGARCSDELALPFSEVARWVPSGARIFVGCASGIDGFARLQFGSRCRVFRVSSGEWGVGRGAFAGRSVAFVRALSVASGVLVSLPAPGSAPAAGLFPSSSSSRCFSGGGSGSWASLAFAVGSGVPCLVWLGSSPAPVGWGLEPVIGCPGWFSSAPAAVQLSLF